MDYKVTYWDNDSLQEGVIKDIARCVVETNGILKCELNTPESSVLFNASHWVHITPVDSTMDKPVNIAEAIDALYELMDNWKYKFIFEFHDRGPGNNRDIGITKYS